jgi:hypothetical protein
MLSFLLEIDFLLLGLRTVLLRLVYMHLVQISHTHAKHSEYREHSLKSVVQWVTKGVHMHGTCRTIDSPGIDVRVAG